MYTKFYNDILNVLHSMTFLTDHLHILNDGFQLTKPKQQKSGERFGDLSLNLGFIFAPALKISPLEVSEKISKELKQLTWVKETQAIGGFINIHLTDQGFIEIMSGINIDSIDNKYGSSDKKNIKVHMDYASINPTGPMHAGHLRSTIIADSAANILEFAGYDVQREYYINDTGGQAKKLVEAAFARYRELYRERYSEINGEILTGSVQNTDISEYAGEYLVDIVKLLIDEDGPKWINETLEKVECYERFRSFVIGKLLDEIKNDLARLNIHHDTYFSEHEMNQRGEVEKAFELLNQRGLVTKMIMPAPVAYKGERIEDKEIFVLKVGQIDCNEDNQKEYAKLKALTKTDGTHTYLLGDIAYHLNRYERHMDWLVNFFGADHSEHAKVLIEIMTALRPEKKISIKTCQIVKFEKDGQEFKMSKRAGTYITASDILDALGEENGVDAIRISMLSRKADSHLIMDVESALILDETNPVFYIQYAHARCYSVLKKESNNIALFDDIEFFQALPVRDIVLHLFLWPSVVEQTAKNLEPHGVLVYLQDLASLFHTLYAAGNTNENLRLLGRNEFVKSVQHVLSTGMKLLGVTPKDTLIK